MAEDAENATGLPPYAGMMADYHEAFEEELRGVVAAAGVRPGDLVIDAASGDGSYSRWLAELAGPTGKVVAVDNSRPFIELARRGIEAAGLGDRVRFVRMDLRRSPIAEGSADHA